MPEDRGQLPPDPSLAEELAALRRTVEQLSRRVAELEGRADGAPTPAPSSPPPAIETPPARPAPSPSPAPPPVGPPAPPSKPLVKAENLPVVAMAAAGGLALLLGVLYFAWYSVQQGWISPATRLKIIAVFAAAAMAGGWYLGGRGQKAVAAALAGAGLGGWFAAMLVARHVYGYLTPTQTFVLLVVGAAFGLLIGSHRALRLLASLAAIGAFLTPLFVASPEGGLHELMSYQLVVVALLFLLERRHRWGELGVTALLAPWSLMTAWVSEHVNSPPHAATVGWAFTYLVLGHLQVVLLLRAGQAGALLAGGRTWLNAVLAWGLATSGALNSEHGEAWVALAMAIGNLGLCAFVRRLDPAAPIGKKLSPTATVAGALFSVGWLQLFTFAPLRWEDATVPGWWFGMALLPAAGLLWTQRLRLVWPLLFPWASGVAWCLLHETTASALLGHAFAALPLVLALAPRRETVKAGGGGRDLVLALMLLAGGLVWGLMAREHPLRFGTTFPGPVRAHLVCLVAAAVAAVRLAVASPSSMRIRALLALLALQLVVSIDDAVSQGLLSLRVALGSEHVAFGLVWIGMAAVCLPFLDAYRRRQEPRAAWVQEAHDLAGLLICAALVVAAMSLTAGSVAALEAGSRSQLQAGWSVIFALAGLTLLMCGLFRRRPVWRRVGIAALFATAAKVALVDLVEVTMATRVISLVVLGACLLLGAFAYRRLGAWLEQEPPEPPTP